MRKINKERAMQIYRIMIEYQHEEGFSMTAREVADAVGLVSNSDVSVHIRWLIQVGYAKIKGRQIRAITQEG